MQGIWALDGVVCLNAQIAQLLGAPGSSEG